MKLMDVTDIPTRMQQINQEAEKLRQWLVSNCAISYECQDVRMVMLEALQQANSSVGLWMNSLVAIKYELFAQGMSEVEYLERIGCGLKSAGMAEDMMIDYLRISYITTVNFKVEHLLRTLLSQENGKKLRGFSMIVDALNNKLSDCLSDIEKNYLLAFAAVRNSLHNNGINCTADLDVIISGVEHNVRKGHAITCAGWEHIIELVARIIDVVSKILRDANMRMDKEILDEFVSLGI
ncbi:MAG: hypothetical protein WCP79_00595 [Bacillota bacterium]